MENTVKDNTHTFTRVYQDREITVTRRKKPINYDIKKQIRISSEMMEQINERLEEEKDVKDFSSLVRGLLEEYLEM